VAKQRRSTGSTGAGSGADGSGAGTTVDAAVDAIATATDLDIDAIVTQQLITNVGVVAPSSEAPLTAQRSITQPAASSLPLSAPYGPPPLL
jgi:hypothetical protein